jgi:hypothetical protein
MTKMQNSASHPQASLTLGVAALSLALFSFSCGTSSDTHRPATPAPDPGKQELIKKGASLYLPKSLESERAILQEALNNASLLITSCSKTADQISKQKNMLFVPALNADEAYQGYLTIFGKNEDLKFYAQLKMIEQPGAEPFVVAAAKDDGTNVIFMNAATFNNAQNISFAIINAYAMAGQSGSDQESTLEQRSKALYDKIITICKETDATLKQSIKSKKDPEAINETLKFIKKLDQVIANAGGGTPRKEADLDI